MKEAEVQTLPAVKLDPRATIPTRSHDTDAGWDLYNLHPVTLAPGEFQTVHTGIAIDLKPGTFGKIEGRSGLATEGVAVLGGVVDAGYNGEIRVVLHNVGHNRLIIYPNNRMAQLVVQPLVRTVIEEVESIDGGERGANGFGSTGA